jgi:hypothetical protein
MNFTYALEINQLNALEHIANPHNITKITNILDEHAYMEHRLGEAAIQYSTISHIYFNQGNYQPKLSITTNDGCQQSFIFVSFIQ